MGLLGEAKVAHDIKVIFETVKADLQDLGEFTEIVDALKDATTALRESNG